MPRARDELTPQETARLTRARERLERERARWPETIAQMIDEGASPAAIARALGVSRQAIYAQLARRED